MANCNNNKLRLRSNRVLKENVDLYKVEPCTKIVCYKLFFCYRSDYFDVLCIDIIVHTTIKSFKRLRIIIRGGYFMENAIKILSLINSLLCLLSHVV